MGQSKGILCVVHFKAHQNGKLNCYLFKGGLYCNQEVGKMYTYKIGNVSETDKWIYVKCIEENSVDESESFVELLKTIAIKWNNSEWNGKISSVGNMRYKVENDPIDLVYQWDDLFGIVFEYKDNTNLDAVKSFITNNYNIG